MFQPPIKNVIKKVIILIAYDYLNDGNKFRSGIFISAFFQFFFLAQLASSQNSGGEKANLRKI